MSEPRLSVRSANARDLAHRIAKRERCSVASVVERALDAYERRAIDREPASAFYTRLRRDYGTDLNLDAIIREGREPHLGPDL